MYMANAHNFRLILNIWLTLVVANCVRSEGELTQVDRDEILASYNLQRRCVVPTATNLIQLEWSTKLENIAQKAANTCIFEHNYDGEFKNLGENIYSGYRNASSSVMIFYLERELYDYKNNTCSTKSPKNKYSFDTCGHYFQNVSPLISKIGCARRLCGEAFLLFCEFDAGVNPKVPYPTGPPCSACPKSAPWCYRNLCVSNRQKEQLQPNETSCQVICKNCARLNKESCTCECQKGLFGPFCERRNRRRVPTLSCSPCEAVGEFCNASRGVEDLGSKFCQCNCIPPYSGKNCNVFGYESRLKYVGCFSKNTAISSLNNARITFVNSTNIIAICSEHCSMVGYELLALTDGNVCSCGKSLAGQEAPLADNQCELVCKHESTSLSKGFCGGSDGQANVYQTPRSIELKLHGEVISHGVYPIDPLDWEANVWPKFRSATKTSLNKFCKNVVCCNSMKNVLFSDNQFNGEVKRSNDGYTYLTLQVFCLSGKRVKPTKVRKAITNDFEDINLQLRNCCNVQIQKNIEITSLK